MYFFSKMGKLEEFGVWRGTRRKKVSGNKYFVSDKLNVKYLQVITQLEMSSMQLDIQVWNLGRDQA